MALEGPGHVGWGITWGGVRTGVGGSLVGWGVAANGKRRQASTSAALGRLALGLLLVGLRAEGTPSLRHQI